MCQQHVVADIVQVNGCNDHLQAGSAQARQAIPASPDKCVLTVTVTVSAESWVHQHQGSAIQAPCTCTAQLYRSQHNCNCKWSDDVVQHADRGTAAYLSAALNSSGAASTGMLLRLQYMYSSMSARTSG